MNVTTLVFGRGGNVKGRGHVGYGKEMELARVMGGEDCNTY